MIYSISEGILLTTRCRYFKQVLSVIVSPQFYDCYIKLPSADSPTPDYICSDPKFFPFFRGARGAVDGTHINACPTTAEDHHLAHNRKGGVSQNCLAICDWDLHFVFFVSGWEGSSADAEMYQNARFTNLTIPEDQYFLADAGFGACDTLLVPYRAVRYHLAEWGRASVRL